MPGTAPPPPEKRAAAIVAAPPVPDSTYYSARDLDTYPRPVVPLRLDFLEGAGARLVLQLLIDEHGAVREVIVVDAALRSELEERVRSALAATRFTPAMKDERAVKSRVLVRHEPGAAGRE